MRSFAKIIVAAFTVALLAGCGDTITDIKEAASGINSKANEAATAISQDVHSIRAIEIEHNGKNFTVNDLFKNILRDVQWYYEKNEETDILRVTGTWQPTLFEQLDFDPAPYPALAEVGAVEFLLQVNEQTIAQDQVQATVVYDEQEVFTAKGEQLYQYLLEYYINR